MFCSLEQHPKNPMFQNVNHHHHHHHNNNDKDWAEMKHTKNNKNMAQHICQCQSLSLDIENVRIKGECKDFHVNRINHRLRTRIKRKTFTHLIDSNNWNFVFNLLDHRRVFCSTKRHYQPTLSSSSYPVHRTQCRQCDSVWRFWCLLSCFCLLSIPCVHCSFASDSSNQVSSQYSSFSSSLSSSSNMSTPCSTTTMIPDLHESRSTNLTVSPFANTTATTTGNHKISMPTISTDQSLNLSKENVGYLWRPTSIDQTQPQLMMTKRRGQNGDNSADTDSDDTKDEDEEEEEEEEEDDDDLSDVMVVEDVPAQSFPGDLTADESVDAEPAAESASSSKTSSEEQDERPTHYNDNVDYVMHSPRTVQTKYGALQGIVITFVRYNNDKEEPKQHNSTSSESSSPPIITLAPVEAFLGVPYATPPSNNLRFMPPVAPVHWRGVRQANHLSPVCPQPQPLLNSTDYTSDDFPELDHIHSQPQQQQKDQPRSAESKTMVQKHLERLRRLLPFVRNQSEDCLYLNIYVPFEQYYQHRLFQRQRQQQQNNDKFDTTNFAEQKMNDQQQQKKNNKKNKKQRYPVIVFISGDSYETGTGNSFDASIWASYGKVIVVTINYRLGVLGFLPAMVDGSIRGNYGLMDQVAALHWIQENIGEFGGESANVTIVGHGYGAACVHLLMLSPMAKGLFSRVSLMSGSALAPSAIAMEAENNARLLAKELNCPAYDNIQLVDCLKRKSFDELVNSFSSDGAGGDGSATLPNHVRHLSTFGPIVDGIVVMEQPKIMMESMVYGGSLSSTHSSMRTSSASSFSSSNLNGKNHFSPNSASSSSSDLFTANQYSGDILFGVTRVQCPPDLFNIHEERFGINLERRNQILRTLIRNLFDLHQQTIFWTLINEYTDWSRPSEHPINLLDSTIEILGDALVLAPLIETMDLYAAKSMSRFNDDDEDGRSRGNHYGQQKSSYRSFDYPYRPEHHHHHHHNHGSGRLYFYVFQNGESIDGSGAGSVRIPATTTVHTNTVFERLGSMANDELDYLFGAPIAQHVTGHSLGHFRTNWTSETLAQDIRLSQMMIEYFSNFAKYGNPNGSNNKNMDAAVHHHHHHKHQQQQQQNQEFRPESTRIGSKVSLVNWPRYTVGQQRFLMIGYKSRLRDHYQSHRLSYWLNLIPHLLNDYHSLSSSSLASLLLKNNDGATDSVVIHGSDSSGINGAEDITLMFLDQKQPNKPQHNQRLNPEIFPYIKHHLLDNFDDLSTYDGPVRSMNTPLNNFPRRTGGQKKFAQDWLVGSLLRMNADQSTSLFNDSGGKSTSHIALQDQDDDSNGTLTSKRHSSGDNANGNGSGGGENNLLQATIAVGCSLLALNLLVFVGVYYNLQRKSDSIGTQVNPITPSSPIMANHHCQQQQKQMMYGGGDPSITANINDWNVRSQPQPVQHHSQGHVLRVHYADQNPSSPADDPIPRNNTLQRSGRGHHSSQHHHHHHHHLPLDETMVQDSNLSMGCILANNGDGNGEPTSTTTLLLQNQNPGSNSAQYYPLHSFSSSTTTTTTVSGNPTTETDTDQIMIHPSTSQRLIATTPNTSRTIRFSPLVVSSYATMDQCSSSSPDNNNLVPCSSSPSSSSLAAGTGGFNLLTSSNDAHKI